MPGFGDTIIVANYPGMLTGHPIQNLGMQMIVENMYVYGTGATSLEGVGSGNTYLGLDPIGAGTPNIN